MKNTNLNLVKKFIRESIRLNEESGAQLQQLKQDIENAFGNNNEEEKNNDNSHKQKEKPETKKDTKTTTDLDSELVAPGLKIKNRDTGILYTLRSTNGEIIMLMTPEGKKVKVDRKNFEQKFERA